MAKTGDKRDFCGNDAEAERPSPSSYPRQQAAILPQAPPQYQQQQTTSGNTYRQEHQATGAPTAGMALPPPPRESVLPYDMNRVTVIPYASANYRPKSLTLAVVMCVPIIGLFGVHHFYLNRPVMGYMYASTLGILGVGWLVDWFRICSLVKECNEETEEARERGYWLHGERYGKLTKRSLIDAYLMWFPPFGWYGFHQFYVGRTRYAVFCACTLGLNIIGWFVDFFRLPYLVRKANREIEKMRRGETVEERTPYSLMDAYLLALPLGFLGLHHFYVGNTRRGLLFLFTLGVFGLGWLADLFQMPIIVSEANKDRELKARLANALANQPQQQITTTVDGANVITIPSGAVAVPPAHGIQHQHPQQYQSIMSEPPPAYVPHASAGEIVESNHKQPSGEKSVPS